MSAKTFQGKPSNARISQRYGQFPQASGQPWIHVGDDYAGERGDPVWTISDGEILFAGPGELVPNYLADLLMLYRGSDASGNCVITQHDGWVETHNHCDTVLVRTGQRVSRGTQVGTMGDSGNAYGVHLHHEVLQTPASNQPPFSRYDPHNQIEWENKHYATLKPKELKVTQAQLDAILNAIQAEGQATRKVLTEGYYLGRGANRRRYPSVISLLNKVIGK